MLFPRFQRSMGMDGRISCVDPSDFAPRIAGRLLPAIMHVLIISSKRVISPTPNPKHRCTKINVGESNLNRLKIQEARIYGVSLQNCRMQDKEERKGLLEMNWNVNRKSYLKLRIRIS